MKYVKNYGFWLKINVQTYSRLMEAIALDFLQLGTHLKCWALCVITLEGFLGQLDSV